MHTVQASEVRVYISECLIMSSQVSPNGGLAKNRHKDFKRVASKDERWSPNICLLTEKLLMELF